MVNHSCTADLGLDVWSAPLAERAGLFVLGRFFDALGLGDSEMLRGMRIADDGAPTSPP